MTNFLRPQEPRKHLDRFAHPEGQPGYYCQWIPTEDGSAIEWDGGEKFYDHIEWMGCLVEHFLNPWGYKVNGSAIWRGELGLTDTGKLIVKDNVVKAISINAIAFEHACLH